MNRGKVHWFYQFAADVVYWVFRIGWGLRVKGTKDIPMSGPLILAGNHISLLDPMLIGAAKQSLFKGFLGVMVRNLNSVPIRRSGSDASAIKVLAGCLRDGKAVVIFPEGHRMADPDAAEIKAGGGMLAMLGRADVLPVFTKGSNHLFHSFFHRGALELHFGTVIRLADILDTDVPKREAYQLIARRVMEQIRAMGEANPPR